MSNSQYISPQVQRVLATIELMAGKEIDGVEPGKLVAELGCSPADMTRVLANLEQAGWAERLKNNAQRWRLHAKPVQISNTVAHTYRTALNDLQIESNKYQLLG
ncbi:MarR family transcriptional regulator [Pseudoalteromonas sp. DL2-H2.2]|uniref:MarR family transcriptional regulator n=1 Tax=Pseudoalteromonas sp. DL2-H2.2 TaxID=2908889 RepID=UPI001F1BF125|nr:MarR family transcriptional regulator [Pseudoalteromonas sp. DL2-H2.2]MCF2910769.1 MarR family transcriptional regulator [Pseudoalteromonas sp. DL2-H2.2]